MESVSLTSRIARSTAVRRTFRSRTWSAYAPLPGNRPGEGRGLVIAFGGAPIAQRGEAAARSAIPG